MYASEMDSSQAPPSRGYQILIVQLVFLSTASVCSLIRAYVKLFVVKRVLLDDYLIFAAMIGYAAHGAINIDGIINGATGKPQERIETIDQEARSLRAWYLAEVLYPPITLTIRASLCIFLLRLASMKIHIRIIWANFGILAVVSSTFFFLLTFQCNPPSYYWLKAYGMEGSCLDNNIIGFAVIIHAVSSALSDWCLGLLPALILRRANLNKRTKAVIGLLLSLGIIAGMVLIIRLVYVKDLSPGPNFLYKSIDVGIWSVMEPALGIIAACIPTFRPLFKDMGFGWTKSQLRPKSIVNRISRYTDRFSYQSGAGGMGGRNSAILYEAAMREAHLRSPTIDEESSFGSEERYSKAISVETAVGNNRQSLRNSMPPVIPYPPGYRPASKFDQ